jgi:hypothetical protein
MPSEGVDTDCVCSDPAWTGYSRKGWIPSLRAGGAPFRNDVGLILVDEGSAVVDAPASLDSSGVEDAYIRKSVQSVNLYEI